MVPHLFYYLEALVRTLDFACATSQAILDINGVGLSILNFENSNGTCVFACSATVALAGVYFDLDHFGVISLLKNLITINIVE